ncbi:large-conductance mechanosensitive channel [Fimicolochytrium jonesii]|uniref:large-conductance mechanosensitive channel n=1 Tax=Fimicolochytrium jonesii TaxID=1396493 RepID=UPI0022FE0B96|nr:large-conductance mechanosensitive channel [Fimicolochytrium jonesii]KAI8824502.1 large-conductance mechanosensitive channel [Fimicolochytrium jonesii]
MSTTPPPSQLTTPKMARQSSESSYPMTTVGGSGSATPSAASKRPAMNQQFANGFEQGINVGRKGLVGGVKVVGSVMDDFKEFLSRGNVIDLAVGLVMGAAFTAVVTSVVTDLITPVIGLATRQNLKNNYLILRCPTVPVPIANCTKAMWATVAEAQKAGATTWNWGNFLEVTINFLIISIIIFFMVKVYAAAFRRKKPEKKTKECTFCYKDIPIKAIRCPECTSNLEDKRPPMPESVVTIDSYGDYERPRPQKRQ